MYEKCKVVIIFRVNLKNLTSYLSIEHLKKKIYFKHTLFNSGIQFNENDYNWNLITFFWQSF